MNQNKLTDKSRKSKGALQRQSLLDRLKLKELEQPKIVIIISAGAFILHWLANVVASLMLLHFEPGAGELALLISLLLTSLFTFIIAIVALIELLKFSYAGCSISMILAWANFFLHVLLLIYTHYWLGACISFVFALSISILLNRRKSLIKYLVGFILLLFNFALILYPSHKYMQSRELIEDKLVEIDKIIPQSSSNFQNKEKIIENLKFLHTFAPYFGEKEEKITLYSAYYALAVAYNGKVDQAYKLAQLAVQNSYVKQCYVNKIKIYSILKHVEYEEYNPKILTPEEKEAIEKAMSLRKYSEEIGIPDDDDLSELDKELENTDDDFSDLDN